MAERRRASATYRAALVYAAAFAAAVLALGIAAYVAADAEFRRQQDAGLAAEAGDLVRDYELEGMAELRRDVSRREVDSATNVFGYEVLDREARRVAGSLRLPALAPGWHDIDVADPGEQPDAGRALATGLRGGGTLVVAIDTDALEDIDRTLLILLSAAFVTVAAIGVAGALLLGRLLASRLEVIAGTAAAIAGGDLERRVPVGEDRDEFDRLGGAINAMLDRITSLMENLRQVSTDIAHDLRTPLARLRTGLEAALDGPDDAARLRVALERAMRHGDELLSLFGSILRIAEVERGDARATFAPVELAALAAALVEDYAPAIADGGRALRLAAHGPLVVQGDRALLAQALANLIDNAQRHTPAGTTIVVAAQASSGDAVLSVTDDGPGVPAADRARIIRRFVRLEHSRSTAGHGLGLNMVAAIAGAHGGRLEIGDNDPGLATSLVLPSLPDADRLSAA